MPPLAAFSNDGPARGSQPAPGAVYGFARCSSSNSFIFVSKSFTNARSLRHSFQVLFTLRPTPRTTKIVPFGGASECQVWNLRSAFAAIQHRLANRVAAGSLQGPLGRIA